MCLFKNGAVFSSGYIWTAARHICKWGGQNCAGFHFYSLLFLPSAVWCTVYDLDDVMMRLAWKRRPSLEMSSTTFCAFKQWHGWTVSPCTFPAASFSNPSRNLSGSDSTKDSKSKFAASSAALTFFRKARLDVADRPSLSAGPSPFLVIGKAPYFRPPPPGVFQMNRSAA